MPDDVIKNPNRKTGQPAVKPSKYVPEWQRLGKEPVIYEANPSDAMFLNNNKKRAPVKTQSPNTNPTSKVQAPGQEHAPVSPPKTKKPEPEATPPQQTKVSVGQNVNWFDVEKENQSDILYDEIPDPPDSAFEVSDESDEPDAPDQGSEDEALNPGDYGVFVKGELVYKTASLREAESFVEKVLFDEVPDFSKVTIDDIMLIRRLALKIGVLAVSE